ncbi:RNA polymerase sigma factor [Nonomuraea sp. SYSU D8015]|uniref:RNA polymerase sigma factor n=1 Tax=Nonomuraea sp. SYSU D8015 TaxID=2593644 RepID=UPI001660D7A8|nr:RNA polymerase sigma factor [Nonomuraea sp. SYSU D8015]
MDSIDQRPSSAEASDAAIIERSRGRPEAFAQIFDRHADRVHRYLARRIGVTDADDLLSATFLTAFEERHRFDPGKSTAGAAPWLLGIATNLLHNHRRAEVRRLEVLAQAATVPHESSSADRVDARVDASAAAKLVMDILVKQPVGDRDALLLFAWADLSYEQIADALDIPVGTVRSRIHRVRTRMRTSINNPLSSDEGQ